MNFLGQIIFKITKWTLLLLLWEKRTGKISVINICRKFIWKHRCQFCLRDCQERFPFTPTWRTLASTPTVCRYPLGPSLKLVPHLLRRFSLCQIPFKLKTLNILVWDKHKSLHNIQTQWHRYLPHFDWAGPNNVVFAFCHGLSDDTNKTCSNQMLTDDRLNGIIFCCLKNHGTNINTV